MRHFIWFCFPIALFGLIACGDFSNRVYRYGDEIPLRPFVIQPTRTEYGIKNDKLVLKVLLHVTNKSPEKNHLSRNRFTLRVGEFREVERDRTFLEALGVETVSFVPGEDGAVTVVFVLPQDALDQQIALIVDRWQKKKDDRERLTLIEIKKGSPPKNPLVKGEWRTTRSARWE